MARALGYARQADDAPPLEEQRARIVEAAGRLGLDLVDHFEDEPLPQPIGLTTWSRGGIAHVLDLAPRSGRRVLVWRRDLLRVPEWDDDEPIEVLESRRVTITEVAELGELDARSVGCGPSVAAREEATMTGLWINGGPPPYGYRKGPDHVLRVDHGRAAVVRALFEVVREKGFYAAERFLGSRGEVTSGGRRWSKGAIARLVKNRVYVGVVHFGAREAPGRHEAIVSEDLFRATNEAIRARAQAAPGQTRDRRLALVHRSAQDRGGAS
jgi:hypothetical protein